MRKIPFLETICPKCGKRIYLREETDFHARLNKKHLKFFYTCPECGAVEEHPECFLPTFLKEKLIQDELKRKTLIEFVIMLVAIIVALFILLFLFW